MSHPAHDLATELSALEPALLARLAAGGFDPALLLRLAATLADSDPVTRRRVRNTVRGPVRPLAPNELHELPPEGSADRARLAARGAQALREGQLAFCTMAGGMATRMGGIVKALAEVVDGRTFLDLRLAEREHASARAQRSVPLWLMTSEATDATLRHALASLGAPESVACFPQNLSLRLHLDGTLFRDGEGRPSPYATGHGDLVDALRRSGLLTPFIARGGKYVWIANIDNLGATIDEAVLGQFIEATERGVDVQCEVCPKSGDRGGIPVHAEGKLQVLEEFRLPPDFDPASVDVFNTNTFLVRAEALASAPLSFTYFEVEKQVEGQPVIQFERLIQELTAALPSTYLRVPREGAASRFLPVKDYDELERRKPTIRLVTQARGIGLAPNSRSQPQ